MSLLQSVPVMDMLDRGSIKDADVVKLRRAVNEDGVIDTAEAEALLALNEACPVQDASWINFFIEALSDHLVHQARPEGYVTAEKAEWLISRIAADGRIETKTELELLITVLDKARWSPPSLSRFALAQVKAAVLTGDGPLRSGVVLEPGRVAEAEVELLRRILYAFGGDGSLAITQPEAEILFEINDAVCADGATPTPEWTDLFSKAVANLIMAASGYKTPTREEALHSETWQEERGELAPAAFFGRMVSGGLDGVIDAYRAQDREAQALARLERQRLEIVTNEVVSLDEARWLAERIGRDGAITLPEQALLDFIAAEKVEVHPVLGELLGRLSRAA